MPGTFWNDSGTRAAGNSVPTQKDSRSVARIIRNWGTRTYIHSSGLNWQLLPRRQCAAKSIGKFRTPVKNEWRLLDEAVLYDGENIRETRRQVRDTYGSRRLLHKGRKKLSCGQKLHYHTYRVTNTYNRIGGTGNRFEGYHRRYHSTSNLKILSTHARLLECNENEYKPDGQNNKWIDEKGKRTNHTLLGGSEPSASRSEGRART